MRLFTRTIINFKDLIKPDSKLRHILRSIYRRLLPEKFREYQGKKVDSEEIECFIDSFSGASEYVCFVQIGSCDGVCNDPINKFIVRDKWSGILVEPVKYLFDRLVETYRGYKDLIFENVAISDKNEMKDFWYIKESDEFPHWAKLVGSFSREHVLRHADDDSADLKDFVVKEQIDCITIETLLRKHNLEKIDLIHIDTEGYDYEIIKQIPLKRYKPKIIFYEHCHLGSDKKECMNYLYANGYNVIYDDINALVFSNELKTSD